MYDLNRGVIMSGNFVDKIPVGAQVNKIGRWHKVWFHRHVASFLGKKASHQEVSDFQSSRLVAYATACMSPPSRSFPLGTSSIATTAPASGSWTISCHSETT